MSKGLFITAIGTDIGKTYVTGLLVKRLRDAGVNAGYYKAALSGAEEQPDGTWLPGDAVFVAKTANIPEKPENLVSYIYKEAVSPHLAALREGNPVEMEKIEADYQASLAKYDYVTMEGSGGAHPLYIPGNKCPSDRSVAGERPRSVSSVSSGSQGR